jgi:transcriptional regulator with XRE-family HTH domain
VTEDLKPIIAARVRAARKARGLTQAALAEAISRTEEAVSNLERAKSLPPLDILQQIASELDVNVIDLLQVPSMSGPVSKRASLEMDIRAIAESLPIDRLRIAARQMAALAERSD